MKNLISVIIPIHNCEKYLRKCIDSVINQTYFNLEILLINDSSTDNSSAICEEYQNKDRRIKCFKVLFKSAGKTRNFGIEKSTGEYIVFIDSDDYVEETLVEKMLNAIQENMSDTCFCSFYNVYDKEKKQVYKNAELLKIYNKNEIRNELIFNTIYVEDENVKLPLLAIWNGMYSSNIIKKKKLGFLDENDILSEDSLFNFNYLLYSNRVVTINTPLYNHLKENKNSICNKYNKRFIYIYKWYNYIKELSTKESLNQNKIDYYLNEMYVIFSIASIRQEIFLSNKSEKQILNKILEILNDEQLKTALKVVQNKHKNIKSKLLYFLMRKKYIHMIYFLFKLR